MDNKHAENKLWDKTKSILFAFKFRKKNVKKLKMGGYNNQKT